MLVAATNPCPCGFYGDRTKCCSCTLPQLQKYRARLSGPLLDRLDIQVEVPAVRYQDLADRLPGEPPKVSANGSLALARSKCPVSRPAASSATRR